MPSTAPAWETYQRHELARATPVLARLGFVLDVEQPHLLGERFLMAGERDVGGGGYKLVLLGSRAHDGRRVVIKASSERNGIREIETERRARETVRSLPFAYQTITVPTELLFTVLDGYRIFITDCIEQERTFISRPLPEQFALALRALKAQESIHATTSAHAREVEQIFGSFAAPDYLRSFETFVTNVRRHGLEQDALAQTLERARAELATHRETIEQYCGFLTHADFVPHNIRVNDGHVFLLDAASLHFGNKYESWGRFTNFMLLYNRPLEAALIQYVSDNRTPEEVLSLRLMRIYKLGKLLEYHVGAAAAASGDVAELSRTRVTFWLAVLESLLDDKPLDDAVIVRYQRDRDLLRSEEEKKRQAALH
ncbi:MAG: hypothetical protein AAB442_03655 [Patescibacteria group bacterium]